MPGRGAGAGSKSGARAVDNRSNGAHDRTAGAAPSVVERVGFRSPVTSPAAFEAVSSRPFALGSVILLDASRRAARGRDIGQSRSQVERTVEGDDAQPRQPRRRQHHRSMRASSTVTLRSLGDQFGRRLQQRPASAPAKPGRCSIRRSWVSEAVAIRVTDRAALSAGAATTTGARIDLSRPRLLPRAARATRLGPGRRQGTHRRATSPGRPVPSRAPLPRRRARIFRRRRHRLDPGASFREGAGGIAVGPHGIALLRDRDTA